MTEGPRAEPASFALLDRLWAEHGAEQEWVFTSHMMRHGDLFIALSLMEAFRREHAEGRPIRLITVTRGQAAVAAMFMHVLDSVHIATPLAGPPVEHVMAWNTLRGRFDFAPGRMLLLQPWVLAQAPLRLQTLVDGGRLSYTEVMRSVLRLPACAATVPPPVGRDDRAAALALLRDSGLVPGRTLVLFPYAQSFVMDWSATLGLVAVEARAEGWQVVTSCAGKEVPLPGTAAVDVPFPLLRPFCEAAGHAVSVRSGISDILAQTACRHVALYSRPRLLDIWGLQGMGLGGTTAEMHAGDPRMTPTETAAQIWTLLTEPDEGAQSVFCPAEVGNALRLLAAHGPSGGATRALSRAGAHVALSRGIAYPGVALTEGWIQEDWGVWSFGNRASLWLSVPEKARRVRFLGHAAVSEGLPDLHVAVTLGRMRHPLTLRWPTQDPFIDLPLPFGLKPGLPVPVGIEIRNPQSPALLTEGANLDGRPLGLALRGVGYA